MSTGSPSEPLRLTLDHRGRARLLFADSIPPRRVLDILCSRFGAEVRTRTSDPLGDWTDLRLSVCGHEVELITEPFGPQLFAPTDAASQFLHELAPRLSQCLVSSPKG
jgi:hypothetical protein